MPRRRRNARISEEDKQRIIEKYEANEDFLVTAADLGIKRTTAYGIIRNYQNTGHVHDGRHRAGRYNVYNVAYTYYIHVHILYVL